MEAGFSTPWQAGKNETPITSGGSFWYKDELMNVLSSLFRRPGRLATLGLLFLLTGGSMQSLSAQSTSDSTILKAAGPHYLKNAFHRFWWGSHYRKVWAEPVPVPVLRLDQMRGGLIPLEQGGSFQTRTLRLEDKNGHEFVLRSIDKDPARALPDFWRKTFVATLMRDQTSVIHPYGAFIVPALAQAAQVYHTNPQLVYIAQDKALGEFEGEFAGQMALLEERPDGAWPELASFGNPKEVISSKKAFGHLFKNTNYQVEAKRYLRSRLFDMWLSDWSRREDQWRWGEQKKGKQINLEPIPRDRDHAFFKFKDGVLTSLISLFKANYQSFDHTISHNNVKGLTKSSRRMDAYFLAYLTKQDFEEVARELQTRLSDEVIDQAIAQWPAQIQALSAKEFSNKLKERRGDLLEASNAFYALINQEVLLPGTDEEDVFHLELQENGNLLVQFYSEGKKDSLHLIHQKNFYPQETKSLDIYGLGEEDTFVLKGAGKNKIKVRLYGGEGEDELKAGEAWKPTGQTIFLMDEEDGNQYPKVKGVDRKEHSPSAQEFSGKGWLLRHRLH
ncbi:hypothetical protein GU926_02130 [Nibribacter ruber]|uniref:Uncharacterized protein n=1 Tax=Nibribacter ruber TaxID=2698458 RepID=A0A6P1NVD1_9BACT|nr:hypothetical protein [Nibribacter ruber]QHL86304.1 hypothetical protein GU926_02130 [Nibribacter ruber]